MPTKKTAVTSDDPPAPSSSDAAPEEVVVKKKSGNVCDIIQTSLVTRDGQSEASTDVKGPVDICHMQSLFPSFDS